MSMQAKLFDEIYELRASNAALMDCIKTASEKLYSAKIQRSQSDDKIIANKIDEAHLILAGAASRARLAARLANRKKKPLDHSDIGIPHYPDDDWYRRKIEDAGDEADIPIGPMDKP